MSEEITLLVVGWLFLSMVGSLFGWHRARLGQMGGGYGMAAGGATAAAGAIGQHIGGLLQKKPRLPRFKEVDAQLQQGKAIAGNIEHFDESARLAELVNKFGQEEVNKMLEAASPGYFDTRARQKGVIDEQLAGDLPKGVVDQIRRRAAEFGVSSGTAGSDFQGFEGLRQLGLNSLAYTQAGLDNASQWLSGTKTAPMFNASSMFFSPQEQLAHATLERDKKLVWNAMRAGINAAYHPSTIAGNVMVDVGGRFLDLGFDIMGSSAGTGGGGGGGGGGGMMGMMGGMGGMGG